VLSVRSVYVSVKTRSINVRSVCVKCEVCVCQCEDEVY